MYYVCSHVSMYTHICHHYFYEQEPVLPKPFTRPDRRNRLTERLGLIPSNSEDI